MSAIKEMKPKTSKINANTFCKMWSSYYLGLWFLRFLGRANETIALLLPDIFFLKLIRVEQTKHKLWYVKTNQSLIKTIWRKHFKSTKAKMFRWFVLFRWFNNYKKKKHVNDHYSMRSDVHRTISCFIINSLYSLLGALEKLAEWTNTYSEMFCVTYTLRRHNACYHCGLLVLQLSL